MAPALNRASITLLSGMAVFFLERQKQAGDNAGGSGRGGRHMSPMDVFVSQDCHGIGDCPGENAAWMAAPLAR